MSDISLQSLLVVPGRNTMVEPEMTALCPSLAPFELAPVPRPATTFRVADLASYRADTLNTVAKYGHRAFDLVFHACTAAGFLSGVAGNRTMVEALADKTGARAISTAFAMVDLLQAHSITRVAVLTPYLDELNDGICTFLGEVGIRVVVLDSFRAATSAEMLAIDDRQVHDRALTIPLGDAQALFIACAQLPSLAITAPLQARLGVPVWSSIGATAWAGRRAAAELIDARSPAVPVH